MAYPIIQYPVSLALKKILKDGTSGELIVRDNDLKRSIYFKEGRLVSAKTNVIHERFGEILYKLEKIDSAQFQDLSRLLEGKNKKIGEILIEHQILNEEDVSSVLTAQMKTILLATFLLATGEWEFVLKEPALVDDYKISIDLESVIIAGIREGGNVSYFKNKYFYHSPQIAPMTETLKDNLPHDLIDFYNQLTSYRGGTNDLIISKLESSDNQYWQNIAILFLLSTLTFVEMAVNKELSQNIEEIIELFENIKAKKIDYYQLFNLSPSASLDEIKTVYFKFAKKYHPDRIQSAPDPDIKDKANLVFAEINKAYEILSNEDRKQKYDEKGFNVEDAQSEMIDRNLSERAKMLFRKAKTLFSQNKFWEAATLMDEAVNLDRNKAAYFLLLGQCQVNIPSLRRMAEKNLERAVELDSWNAEAHYTMGILFINENMKRRAEGFLRKAVSINPDHDKARKKLETLLNIKPQKKSFALFSKGKKKS